MNNKVRELVSLIEEFQSRGVVRSELLLTPRDASELVTRLAELDVLVIGCYGWRWANKDKGWVVQDLSVEMGVEDYISYDLATVEESAYLVKRYLDNLGPDDIDFVSLHIDDIEIYEAFNRNNSVGESPNTPWIDELTNKPIHPFGSDNDV